MEVHNHMGPGLLESVYHECLEIEFELQNIPFISKPKLGTQISQIIKSFSSVKSVFWS